MKKRIADMLTSIRAVVAVSIVLIGLNGHQESIGFVMFLMMVSWVSDYFDGWLARRADAKHSWLGDHDLLIDLAASVGLLIYLVGVGFISAENGSAYVLVWVLVFTWLGINKSTGSTFQALIYGYFLWLVAERFSVGLLWLVGWFLFILVFDWQRFTRVVVPEYLHGLKATFWDRKKDA